MGFVESPISKSYEDFVKEADQHQTDTVISIPQERFDKFCEMVSILNGVYNSESRHDYRISIKYKDTDIAIPLPVPDSLNDKVVAYIGDKKKACIRMPYFMKFYVRQDILTSLTKKTSTTSHY